MNIQKFPSLIHFLMSALWLLVLAGCTQQPAILTATPTEPAVIVPATLIHPPETQAALTATPAEPAMTSRTTATTVDSTSTPDPETTGKLQLVMFYAPRCALACGRAVSTLHGLEQEFGQQVTFTWVNIFEDECQSMRRQFGFTKLPEIYLVDGQGNILGFWDELNEAQPLREALARFGIAPISAAPQVLEPASQLGKGQVFASALSPDGQYLAVSSPVGIYLYKSPTFEVVWFQPTDEAFDDLAFSPDSRLLALGRVWWRSWDRLRSSQVEIWGVSDGKQVRALPPISYYRSVIWSPDGTELLTSSKTGSIVRWRADTAEKIAEVQPDQGTCSEAGPSQSNAIWSVDSKYIISANRCGTLKVWDASTNNELFALTHEILGTWPDESAASPVPGDYRVVVGLSNFEKGALVVDSQKGQVLQKLDSWLMVTDLAWSPDGKLVALTASAHNTIEIWDATSYTLLKSIHIEVTRGMDWSADSQTLYVANKGQVMAVRVSDDEIIRTLDGYTGGIGSIHWDYQHSIQAGLVVWNAATLEISATVQQKVDFDHSSVVQSPDGKMRASHTSSAILIEDNVSHALHKLLTEFSMSWDDPIMAWSPDGTMLGVSGAPNSDEGGMVEIWDVQNATLLYRWIENDRIDAIAWSPNGQYVAFSTGEDGQITVREIKTGNILFYLYGHRTTVYGLAWSPNGQRIASGDANGQIFIWGIPVNP